jgi:hypothetical protein
MKALAALLLLGISAFALSNKEKDLLDAARRGNIQAVRSTIAAGAGVECRDKDRRTPLMLAAQSGDPDVVRLLLEQGAKPGSRDKDGLTAYGLALGLPAGKREPVLAALPKPAPVRLAADTAWLPESMTSSCYLSRPDLADNIERLHLDAIAAGAFAEYARANGKDFVDIVRADAEGPRTGASEMEISETGVDAVIALAVRPGVFCSSQGDSVYLAIDVRLMRAGQKEPVWRKTYGGGLRGLHTRTVNSPSQYRAYFEEWVRNPIASIYAEALRELLRHMPEE